ncbi:MAG: hypothetical protein ACPGTO_00095 [Polaribacter sp.]
MKKIKLLLIAFSVFALQSCEDLVEAPQTPYATFNVNSDDFGVEIGTQETKEYTVYTANVTNTERTITVSVVANETDADPASYTVPTTLTIPAGSNSATLPVTVQDINLDEDKKLVIKLEQTENLFTGEKLTLNISQLCPTGESKVKITLTFDDWPEEVYWRLINSNGVTVYASADTPVYGAYAGMTGSITEGGCLPSDTYTIDIYDSYGDGGTEYSVTVNGVSVYSLSGNYGGGTSAAFTF